MAEDKPTKVAFAATGVANLASIMAAFRRAGAEPFLAASPDELADAPFATVPGVGAFGAAMAALSASGMDQAIRDRITRGAPTLGVCAGMQLFFEGSDESPGVEGMGIVPGVFRRFPSDVPVPQLGWNSVFALRAKTDELRSSRQDTADAELESGESLDDAERSSAGHAEPSSADELRSSSQEKLTPVATLDSAERSSAVDARRASTRLVGQGWAYFANSYRLSEGPAGFELGWAEYGERFVASLESPGDGGKTSGLLLCQFHPELSGPWGLALIRAWLGSSGGQKGGAS